MIGASGLDWGNETFHSLWWIAKAFVITSVIFLAVIAVLIRFTEWGRQFWRVTGEFFIGRRGWAAGGLLAAVMVSTIFAVRMQVLFTYYTNDMYSSLQFVVQALADGNRPARIHAEHLFWDSITVFVVLATLYVLQYLVSYWVYQVLVIRWWEWLNNRVVGDWLVGKAFYRSRFIDNTIDNADQRIQQDVNDFVNTSCALAFGGNAGSSGYQVTSGVVNSGVTLVSFTPILWHLSGPVTIFGWHIPRALIFATFGYLTITSILSFWIGHPLIRLNFRYQRFTANFRYALVRLRDNAESVAFYHGESVERGRLFARFEAMIGGWWAIVYRSLRFNGWNLTVSQVAQIFVAIFLAPRIFSGSASLGDFQQAASAFLSVHDSLSVFRNSYDSFSYYRSTLIRLDGMTQADRQARTLPVLATEQLADALELQDVRVAKPDGTPLVTDLALRLTPGEALVVKGRSGSGKTTLLRSIAQLWPYTDGRVRRPLGDRTLFLSQLPYLPLGDLRTAVAYPAGPADFDDATLRAVLHRVSLGHLTERLDEEADWTAILSPGEQQRVAFARVLLIRPTLVFLDEATSAVDEGVEYTLYHLVRTETPNTMLVSVAHRSTVDIHHTQRLHLIGDGTWTLAPLSA